MVVGSSPAASEREGQAAGLHLPDLLIQGFRGIAELAVPRLGRATLLVGRNGAGKTTVLDAVRVYAARGSYPVLSDLLGDRDEVLTGRGAHPAIEPDWESLFHGREISDSVRIAIGSGQDAARQLRISPTVLDAERSPSLGRMLPRFILQDRVHALHIMFGNDEQLVPYLRVQDESSSEPVARQAIRETRRFLERGDPLQPAVCEFLGPGLLGNAAISLYWDKVALTDDEERAMDALRMIGVDVDRVAMIGSDTRVARPGGRRVIVRLASQDRPVPLRSLGEGARRMFGIALALANSRGGFLLIDEAENGLHHSVQHRFWRMVLGTALANNVQVLATTHSWDCVRGFAKAASEQEQAEGMLYRIERDNGKVRAVDYPEEEIGIAVKQGIEVR